MKRIVGYALAAILGGGFWTWVAAATAAGIVRTWWRHLAEVYGDPPRHMIHAETRPQPSSPHDAARIINASAEYPIGRRDSDAELDAAVALEDSDNPPIEDPFVDRLEEHPGYER